jgi:hypothetical protein
MLLMISKYCERVVEKKTDKINTNAMRCVQVSVTLSGTWT